MSVPHRRLLWILVNGWEERAHQVMNEQPGWGWMEALTASEHKTELAIQRTASLNGYLGSILEQAAKNGFIMPARPAAVCPAERRSVTAPEKQEVNRKRR